MPLQNTQAIVIGSLNLGETDRLITFYTQKFGKLKAVARGSRRLKSRWVRSAQPLTHCMIFFYEKQNKQLHRLKQCDIINAYSGLLDELSTLTAGLYVAELAVKASAEEEPAEELFYLILQILKLIQQGKDTDTCLRIFEIRTLSLLGYQPQMSHCLRCRKPIDKKNKVIFSPVEGGVICKTCRKHVKGRQLAVSIGSLSFLQTALRLNLGKIDRLGLAKTLKPELKEMLHSCLIYHLEREINSFYFLEI